MSFRQGEQIQEPPSITIIRLGPESFLRCSKCPTKLAKPENPTQTIPPYVYVYKFSSTHSPVVDRFQYVFAFEAIYF